LGEPPYFACWGAAAGAAAVMIAPGCALPDVAVSSFLQPASHAAPRAQAQPGHPDRTEESPPLDRP
jgi:hypothetical protein